MQGWYEVDVFLDGKIYSLNEKAEEEEGKRDWGGKIKKIVEEEENKIELAGKIIKLRRREFKNEEEVGKD